MSSINNNLWTVKFESSLNVNNIGKIKTLCCFKGYLMFLSLSSLWQSRLSTLILTHPSLSLPKLCHPSSLHRFAANQLRDLAKLNEHVFLPPGRVAGNPHCLLNHTHNIAALQTVRGQGWNFALTPSFHDNSLSSRLLTAARFSTALQSQHVNQSRS